MKIKTHLTITFTLLVAGIITIFSISVYLFYLNHRNDDFLIRLQNRAKNTAGFLLDVKEIDSKLLKVIDQHTLTNMNDVTIIILNNRKEILYSNRDDAKVNALMPNFKSFNWDSTNNAIFDKRLYTCVKYNSNNQLYYVLATAYDLYGMSELKKLETILIFVFIISLFIIFFAALFNAKQSLKPIKEIIHQVNDIKINKLNTRLEIDTKDEIAELAANFNNMLDRIEDAFDTERMFISNASLELVNPLIKYREKIKDALDNQHTENEYKLILNSLLDETKGMSAVIEGFLELARVNIDTKNINYEPIRLIDIIQSLKAEFQKTKAGNTVTIKYNEIYDASHEPVILGNEKLLRILISNLIDNACKFSNNKEVIIDIHNDISVEKVTVKFIDNGIGIPNDEIDKIIRPLYRAQNVNGQSGHGIGLSIVHRIAELHYANMEIHSIVNIGTTISLSFAINN
jgi:signal transduction histidine kinase